MSTRSPDARRLSVELEQRLTCRVDVRWDSDGGPWTYWVEWTDGPTAEQMRAAAAEVAEDLTLSLDAGSCRYWRGLSRLAWAVQLVRHVAGGGQLGEGAWERQEFQERLMRTPDVDRASDHQEARLAEVLVRLAGVREESAMWDLLRAHGLSVLGQGPPPPGVTPLRPPQA